MDILIYLGFVVAGYVVVNLLAPDKSRRKRR